MNALPGGDADLISASTAVLGVPGFTDHGSAVPDWPHRRFCNVDHTGNEADAEALMLATGPTSARLLDWATQPAAKGP
jgi:hypothetical protein